MITLFPSQGDFCATACRPLLTQLIELRLSLFQGAALQAKPLAMRSKTLPFLRQLLRWNLTHGIECLGLGWGVREEFPRALAL